MLIVVSEHIDGLNDMDIKRTAKGITSESAASRQEDGVGGASFHPDSPIGGLKTRLWQPPQHPGTHNNPKALLHSPSFGVDLQCF